MKKTLSVLVVNLLLIACIKEVPIQNIPFEKKLVIGCVANPDSVFRVNIRCTSSIRDTSEFEVLDAKVKLFKNNILIDTLQYQNSGWYISSIEPEVEEHYSIEVSNDNVAQNAKAVLEIPKTPIIDSAYFTIGKTFDSQQYPITTLHLIINDSLMEADYYEFQLLSGGITDYIISTSYSTSTIHIYDPSIISDSNLEYLPSTFVFSDALFNGNKKDLALDFLNSYDLDSSGNLIPNYDFFIIIRKLSPSYYNYLRSWTVHRFNQNTDFNTKEPLTLLFQGDPVELYTNVENGYGIFCAYNEVVVQAQFVP